MFYSKEVIEEIRNLNNIIDLVGNYVSLKQKGSSWFGLCPFHKEKTPSFSVSDEKQIFHCFGCGAAGNVFGFVMRIENISFINSVRFLADRVGYELSEHEKNNTREKLFEINRLAAKFYYKNLLEAKKVLSYLEKRNINAESRKIFGLGYGSNNIKDLYEFLIKQNFYEKDLLNSGLFFKNNRGELCDRFFKRLILPIRNINGRVIGFGGRLVENMINNKSVKYINSPESKLYIKSENLYNLDLAIKTRKNNIILVEGYLDAISLYQAGIKNVVAVLGTAFSLKQASLLKKYFECVIILFDNDLAGDNARLKAIKILEEKNLEIKVLELDNAKDVDEYIKKFGSDSFLKLLDSYVLDGVEFKLRAAEKKYDLKNTSDEIKFLQEASQIIFELQDKIKQEIYIKKLAERVGISRDAIREEIKKIDLKKNMLFEKKYIEKANKFDEQNVIEDFLNLLAKKFYLVECVKKYLLIDELENEIHAKILEKIYWCHEKKIEFNIANVISEFEKREDQEKATRVFIKEINYENINKALEDMIKIIKKNNLEKKIAEIIKSNDDCASDKLKKLFKAKREIDLIKFEFKN